MTVLFTHDVYGEHLAPGDTLRAIGRQGGFCVGEQSVPDGGNFTLDLAGQTTLPGGDTLRGLGPGEEYYFLLEREGEHYAFDIGISEGSLGFDQNVPYSLVDSISFEGALPPDTTDTPPADTTDVEPPEEDPEPLPPDTVTYRWMGESGPIPDWRENPLDSLPSDQQEWTVRLEGFVSGYAPRHTMVELETTQDARTINVTNHVSIEGVQTSREAIHELENTLTRPNLYDPQN